MPGGVGLARWQVTGSVQAFLGATGMGTARDLTAVVRAIPAAAIVKGVDGPDWVLACVLFDVHATVVTSARVGYGDCQRMQWQPDPDTGTTTGARSGVGGRWMIGPGAAAVRAPSVWPGSDLAARAGWRRWVSAAPDHQGGQPSGLG